MNLDRTYSAVEIITATGLFVVGASTVLLGGAAVALSIVMLLVSG